MIFRFVDVEHVLFVASDIDEARDLNIPKRNSLAKLIGIYISMTPPASSRDRTQQAIDVLQYCDHYTTNC